MKGAIIYRTRYGGTRQYAEWLAEETGFEIKNVDEDSIDLALYDKLIIGSGVRVGRMIISRWLSEHKDEIKGKDIIIFSVGGYPPSETEEIEKTKKNSIPAELEGSYRHFALHGRISMELLRWWERIAFRVMAKLNKGNRAFAEIVKGFDNIKKEHIKPIVEECRK